jgi:hypothetical protein
VATNEYALYDPTPTNPFRDWQPSLLLARKEKIMPTFIMLSSAASESGSNPTVYRPNVYQFHRIDQLLGLSPGCEYDKDDSFNGQLWYAFAEILEGDHSQISSLDLMPGNWYSPESIINIDCEVVADNYLKDQEPEWWAKMVEARGEPTRSYWGDSKFEAPEDGEEVGSPEIYSLTEAQERHLDEETKAEIVRLLRQDVVQVTDVEVDEDGLTWGKDCNGKLVKLSYRADGEDEWEMFEDYKLTDYVDKEGDVMYVER